MPHARPSHRRALGVACALALLVAPAARAQGPVAHTAVLGPHATFILTNLASGVLAKVGGDAFGHALEQIGLGKGADPQLGAVSRQLANLDVRLQSVEGHVDRIETSLAYGRLDALVGRAAPLLSHVDTAMTELKRVAGNAFASEAARKISAQKLAAELAAFGDADQELLNEIVHSTKGPATDDIISAADRAERSHGRRYWDAKASADVRAVVFYYEAKQAQLLLLRVEYELSQNVGVSDDSVRQAHVDEAGRMVAELTERFHLQEAAMPMVVPADPASDLPYGHVLIDTRANRLGHHLVWVYRPGVHSFRDVPRLEGYGLPNNESYRFLLDGRGGASPAVYLKDHRWHYPLGCVARPQDIAAGRSTEAGGRTFWTHDHQYVGAGNSLHGGLVTTNRFSFQITHDAFFQDQAQGCVMYVRLLQPHEHYWWSAS